MISVRSLSKSFGTRIVLDDVSLDVAKGETVVLVGPSGSGKTTLLRCINGLERPDAGEIEVDGIQLNGDDSRRDRVAKLRAIRMRCGFIFQQFHLFPHLSVLQNLVLAPVHVRREVREQAHEHALDLLTQVGLREHADKRPSRLSGGEQQRVAIARALAMKPEYLLYDEPTSSLDLDRAREIWGIIKRLGEEGQTQVIVTHQEDLAQAIPCRMVRMRDGRIQTPPA
jgi:ABC-type polar amino acid transport system ATPase subunit